MINICNHEKDCTNKDKALGDDNCIKCCHYLLPRKDLYKTNNNIKQILHNLFKNNGLYENFQNNQK